MEDTPGSKLHHKGYVYYYITIPSLCEPQKEVFYGRFCDRVYD